MRDYEKKITSFKNIKAYENKDSGSYSKITDNNILEFEKENNIIIPEDYKDFFLKYRSLDIMKGIGDLGVKYFFNENRFFQIEEIYGFESMTYHFDELIKKKYIFIAQTMIDYPVFMSLNEKDYGYIYWMLESYAHFGEEDNFVEVPNDYEEFDYTITPYTFVAKSFTDFILSLKDC